MKKTLLALGALSLLAGSASAAMPGQDGGGIWHGQPTAPHAVPTLAPAPHAVPTPAPDQVEKNQAHRKIASNLPHIAAHLAQLEATVAQLKGTLAGLKVTAKAARGDVRKEIQEHVRKIAMHITNLSVQIATANARLAVTKAAHHDAVTHDKDLTAYHRPMLGRNPRTWGPPLKTPTSHATPTAAPMMVN